jgi:hypothetical protein
MCYFQPRRYTPSFEIIDPPADRLGVGRRASGVGRRASDAISRPSRRSHRRNRSATAVRPLIASPSRTFPCQDHRMEGRRRRPKGAAQDSPPMRALDGRLPRPGPAVVRDSGPTDPP